MSDVNVAWIAPPIDEELQKKPSDAEVEAVFETARESGFAAGYEEGLKQGKSEGHEQGLRITQARADGFLALIENLGQPFRELDEDVSLELAKLAARIGAELARQTIVSHPEQLLSTISSVIGELNLDIKTPRLILSKSDAEEVQQLIESLDEAHPAKHWSIAVDESLERGNLRLAHQESLMNWDLSESAVRGVLKAAQPL